LNGLLVGCGGSKAVTATSPSSPQTAIIYGPPASAINVLSQDDTGPCTPSAAAAAPLFQMIGTLPRSSEADWTQLVADHPITLSVADQRPFRTSR
jgi:hypothetical protein